MNLQLTEEEVGVLRSALAILTRILPDTTHPPLAPKRKPKPAAPSVDLGDCQYLNRRLWKEVHSAEELKIHPSKCTSKACETVHELHLCAKHKKNDISGLLQMIHGGASTFIIPDHVLNTHTITDPTNTEEAVKSLNKEVARIYQQSKYEVYNGKCHGEECFMLLFEEVAYLIDVVGICWGKTTREDVIHGAKMKHKQRQCYEFKNILEPISEEELKALMDNDLCFGAHPFKE